MIPCSFELRGRPQAPRTPAGTWWAAAFSAALCGWMVALTSPGIAAGLTLLALFWLGSLKWPPVALATILGFYIAPLSHLTAGAEAAVPFDIRLLSAPFLLPLMARQRTGAVPRGMAVWLVAVLLAASISLVWSAAPDTSLEAAVGLIVGGATAVVAARALPYRQVITVVRGFFAATVVLSLLLVPFWGEAVLAGRLRGILGNPNGLGLLIVILVPLLAARYGWRSPAIWIALGVLPFTGSRAATAAVAAELAVWTWVSADRRLRRTLFPCFLTAAVVLAVFALNEAVLVSSSPTSLLRSADSRTSHWQYALEVAGVSGWTGYGFGAFPALVGSSYLLALVEFGALSVFPLGATVAVTVHALRCRRMEVAALAAGGLCNAVFESWLLAGGSLYFVAFWTVMAAGALQRHEGAAEP